jgi:hypothetical protein
MANGFLLYSSSLTNLYSSVLRRARRVMHLLEDPLMHPESRYSLITLDSFKYLTSWA